MAQGEIIELLKKYILLLNLEGISVYKAYLFGSYSTGNETNDSDIDLMIVSDKFDENDDLIIGKVWKLTRKINSKIEPFFIGRKKFEDTESSMFIQEVKSKGIEIA